jgi:hypothetical protein
MIRRFSLMFMLAAVLIAVPIGAASAQSPLLSDLPPGIAKQAEPLLKDMMDRMEGSVMMPAHMADMQSMVEQLPPGIFLQILKLMPDLEMAEMMPLHQQIRQEGGLLEQPPGQILKLVRDLAN